MANEYLDLKEAIMDAMEEFSLSSRSPIKALLLALEAAEVEEEDEE